MRERARSAIPGSISIAVTRRPKLSANRIATAAFRLAEIQRLGPAANPARATAVSTAAIVTPLQTSSAS